MIKHNLLSNRLDEFNNTLLYEFRHTECILRLSMPRYLSMIGKKTSDSQAIIKMHIIKEIFLAGSLLKSEIV